jgi:hypothetical protein
MRVATRSISENRDSQNFDKEDAAFRESILAEIAVEDVESANVGTWEWDISADLVRCCEVTASLFGIPPEERTNPTPLARFVRGIHRSDRAYFAKLIRAARRDGGAFLAEYRTRTLSGGFHRILARGRFDKNVAGITERARGILVDLHEVSAVEPGLGTAVASGDPLQAMTDHVIAAWELGEELPARIFEELKPSFQKLLLSLGLSLAADLKAREKTKARSDLH